MLLVLFRFKGVQAGHVAEFADFAVGVAAIIAIPTSTLDGKRTENILTADGSVRSFFLWGVRVGLLGSRGITGWDCKTKSLS